MPRSACTLVALLALTGCSNIDQTAEPNEPYGTYEHPAQTAAGMESVDPEAYPETPGFTDSERPPTSGLHEQRR